MAKGRFRLGNVRVDTECRFGKVSGVRVGNSTIEASGDTQVPTTSDSPCPAAAADTVPAVTGWSRRSGHSGRPPRIASPLPHSQGLSSRTRPPRRQLQRTQDGGGPQPAHRGRLAEAAFRRAPHCPLRPGGGPPTPTISTAPPPAPDNGARLTSCAAADAASAHSGRAGRRAHTTAPLRQCPRRGPPRRRPRLPPRKGLVAAADKPLGAAAPTGCRRRRGAGQQRAGCCRPPAERRAARPHAADAPLRPTTPAVAPVGTGQLSLALIAHRHRRGGGRRRAGPGAMTVAAAHPTPRLTPAPVGHPHAPQSPPAHPPTPANYLSPSTYRATNAAPTATPLKPAPGVSRRPRRLGRDKCVLEKKNPAQRGKKNRCMPTLSCTTSC